MVLKSTSRPRLAYHLAVLAGSLILVALTPINTSLSLSHVLAMGIPLALVIAGPYLLSRYVFKDHVITFHFLNGRRWYNTEIVYILVTASIAYLILPFY